MEMGMEMERVGIQHRRPAPRDSRIWNCDVQAALSLPSIHLPTLLRCLDFPAWQMGGNLAAAERTGGGTSWTPGSRPGPAPPAMGRAERGSGD